MWQRANFTPSKKSKKSPLNKRRSFCKASRRSYNLLLMTDLYVALLIHFHYNLCSYWQVSSDKIGTSVYYWSFPSNAKRTRQIKLDELNKDLQTLQQRQEELENSIQEASDDRQDSVQYLTRSEFDNFRRSAMPWLVLSMTESGQSKLKSEN